MQWAFVKSGETLGSKHRLGKPEFKPPPSKTLAQRLYTEIDITFLTGKTV